MGEGGGWGGKLSGQDRGSRGVPSEGERSHLWLCPGCGGRAGQGAALDPKPGSSREGSHSSSDLLGWLTHTSSLPTQTLQLGLAALPLCCLLGFWALQSHGPPNLSCFHLIHTKQLLEFFYRSWSTTWIAEITKSSPLLLVHLETHFRMESCVISRPRLFFYYNIHDIFLFSQLHYQLQGWKNKKQTSHGMILGDFIWFEHVFSIHFLSVVQSISGNKTDVHKEHSVRERPKGDRTNFRQGNGADRVFLSVWTHKENAW